MQYNEREFAPPGKYSLIIVLLFLVSPILITPNEAVAMNLAQLFALETKAMFFLINSSFPV